MPRSSSSSRIPCAALVALLASLAAAVPAAEAAMTFTRTDIAVGDQPSGVETADLNVDGLDDIVVANRASNTVSILLGQADGTFAQAVGSPLAVAGGPSAIDLGNLDGNTDGDGNPIRNDLVVTSAATDQVRVLLNDADGGNGLELTLSGGAAIAVGDAPSAVAAWQDSGGGGPIDLDGDGDNDLVVANQGSGTVTVLLNSGTGTFTEAAASPLAAGTGPTDVEVDAGSCATSGCDIHVTNPTQDLVTVLHNNGSATVWTPETVAVTGSPQALAFASNKLPGVSEGYLGVARGGDGTLSLLRERTPYAALTPPTIATGLSAWAVTAAGFSRNAPLGRLDDPFSGSPIDFAVADRTLSRVDFALGDTRGGFARAVGTFPVGTQPVSVARIGLPGQSGDSVVTANGAADTVSVLKNVSTAALTPAPAASVFPDQPLGTVGAAQDVVLTNTGGLPLDVLNVSVTGAHPGDFVVASDGCGGLRVRGGLDESCTVRVRLAPQAVGARSATLLVRANDASGPLTASVPLSGTGLDAPAGPTGPVGPVGPTGPTGPQGPAGALVVTAYDARVGVSAVTVRYALTGQAAVALRVTTPAGRTVTVASGTGQAGTNTLTWNRRIDGRPAPAGTYRLGVVAAAGGRTATSERTVRLPVLLAYGETVSRSSVAVRYVLTRTASVRLRVTTPSNRTVTVASATGRAGRNTIRWNRRIGGRRASRGLYELTVRASAGGKVSTSSRTVRLR